MSSPFQLCFAGNYRSLADVLRMLTGLIDAVLKAMPEWRNLPPDAVYPVSGEDPRRAPSLPGSGKIFRCGGGFRAVFDKRHAKRLDSVSASELHRA